MSQQVSTALQVQPPRTGTYLHSSWRWCRLRQHYAAAYAMAQWMALALCSTALLTAAASAGLRAPLGLELHPRPTDLSSAYELHSRAFRAARKTERGEGHTRTDRPGSGAGGSCATAASAAPSPLIDPTALGADPTGKTDSTAAFMRALELMAGNATGRAAVPMASGIQNCGGVTLDLGGGEYLLSQPLAFPDFRGNYRVRGGTLRASGAFPAGRFLIEVGSTGCVPKDHQNVCSEFIGMDNLFLDGGHVAAGCVQVSMTMGTTIGPSAFCTGACAVGRAAAHCFS